MDTENTPKHDNNQKNLVEENLSSDRSSDSNLPESKQDNESAFSQKVSETYADNEALKEKYIRVLADIDNLRKRSIREREEAVTRTRNSLIEDLLPAIDAFKLGLSEAEKVDPKGPVFNGFNMAVSQLESILAEYGLVSLDPTGDLFDPSLHDAIRHEDSDSDEGVVLQTIRCGFRLGESLLRPASVVVSK